MLLGNNKCKANATRPRMGTAQGLVRPSHCRGVVLMSHEYSITSSCRLNGWHRFPTCWREALVSRHSITVTCTICWEICNKTMENTKDTVNIMYLYNVSSASDVQWLKWKQQIRACVHVFLLNSIYCISVAFDACIETIEKSVFTVFLGMVRPCDCSSMVQPCSSTMVWPHSCTITMQLNSGITRVLYYGKTTSFNNRLTMVYV